MSGYVARLGIQRYDNAILANDNAVSQHVASYVTGYSKVENNNNNRPGDRLNDYSILAGTQIDRFYFYAYGRFRLLFIVYLHASGDEV